MYKPKQLSHRKRSNNNYLSHLGLIDDKSVKLIKDNLCIVFWWTDIIDCMISDLNWRNLSGRKTMGLGNHVITFVVSYGGLKMLLVAYNVFVRIFIAYGIIQRNKLFMINCFD